MNKQKLVKTFPILRTIRKKQILLLFYSKMYLDSNVYSKTKQVERLPYCITKQKDKMINENTGQPIEYQYNKVFNLTLAGKEVNHLLIQPNETFSLWMAIRKADKKEKYKEGLSFVDGRIRAVQGGGLCQLSNLLFKLFLNSPLTIVERYTHEVKDFPDPMKETLLGTDATIAEGFLDLKVKNNTNNTFQIVITFDETYLYGELLAQKEIIEKYQIKNENVTYVRRKDGIYELADVVRETTTNNGQIKQEKLYTNVTKIGYELPENQKVQESEE